MSHENRKEEIPVLAETYDQFHMDKVIEGFPGQIEYALTDPELPALPDRQFKRAVVLGMGGSALPVEVLNESFGESLRAPVQVSRHYELPAFIDEYTLIVASSFSGNTEEVLSALEEVKSDTGRIIIIAAGGRLEEIAKENNYPLVHIPRERESRSFQPRCATGYFLAYMARILAAGGILEDPRPELTALLTFFRKLDIRKDAEAAAFWLDKRIPVFYTDLPYERSIARISKIKMNENAKRPAFFNSLPEANHNEMIGFSGKYGNFGILYYRDPGSHPRIHHRFEVMRNVFAEKRLDHVVFRDWLIPGSTKLEKIFSSLIFADWLSYTVALLDHVNPTPVQLVEDFKDLLNTHAS